MTSHKGATIVKKHDFYPTQAANALWKAIDGIGTDEDSIIEIVASCNNAQRQNLKQEFFKIYQKDLMKELNSELMIYLSQDFKHLLRALFMSPVEFDAHCLKSCVKGLGTDEKSLVEILLTRSSEALQQARDYYPKKYGVSLQEDIADDTSGDFRKMVFSLSRMKRQASKTTDQQRARETAQEIDRSFTELKGTDEPRFDLIGFSCTESYSQIDLTYDFYEKLSGDHIHKLINDEFGGDAAWSLRSASKCAKSVPGYLAERIKKSFGITTDEDALIRVVVSRSEIDLERIKDEFNAKYGKSLESEVRKHTGGQFRQLLLAILHGNKPR